MTKRCGPSVVLILSALLVTLLVCLETLVTPLFFLAIMLTAWVGAMGPGLAAVLLATLTLEYFFLPPKYTLRFSPADLPELLAFFVSADPSTFPLALQARRLGGANLEKSFAEPLNVEYRTNMMLGSLEAGSAFSNASLEAVHAVPNNAVL